MDEVQSRLDRQLVDAVGAGNVNQIEGLIRDGANVNAVEGYAPSPLYSAVISGNTEIVKTLIKNGAIHKRERNGYTPLGYAVENNKVELVSFLIENIRGVDLHERFDSSKGTVNPLFCAICSVHTECSKVLTQHIILRDPKVIKPGYVSSHAELSEFWDDFQNQTQNEIKKIMGKEKIGNSNILLYQFLFESDVNKLAGYLSNADVHKEIENIERYKAAYPLYADAIESMITSQYKKGMERRELLDESIVVIEREFPLALPQEVNEKIANYLTNAELEPIIRSPEAERR